MSDEPNHVKKVTDNWQLLLAAAALGILPNQGLNLVTGDNNQAQDLEIRLNSLEQYHEQTWPTERSLISFEIQKVADRLDLVDEKVQINDENIEEIQDMIR